MSLWFASLMGTLAGTFGTGAGGALAFLVKKPGDKLLSTLLSVTAGIMISVVCFELLPEAFALHSLGAGLGGMAAGVVFVIVMDAIVSKFAAQNRFRRAGILMAAGIAVHNFPEGLAIGAGYASAPALGAGLCLLILMHDLPEGLVIGIPLRKSGMGFLRVCLYALLSGVPTGLGALAGYALGRESGLYISVSMGLAGGAMLYLTCSELIPQAGDLHRGRINGVALSIGVALGILAEYITG